MTDAVLDQGAADTRRAKRAGFWTLVGEDYRSHYSDWTRPGFRALFAHRLQNWAEGVRPRLFAKPWRLLGRLLQRHARNRYGIEIPASVKIGRRVHIGHQSGIVFHDSVIIGDDCVIRQGVTLGIRPNKSQQGPILGDRVDIGAGAAIVGPVRIGNGVRIGANAVVMTDVPDDYVVAPPACDMMHKPPRPPVLNA